MFRKARLGRCRAGLAGIVWRSSLAVTGDMGWGLVVSPFLYPSRRWFLSICQVPEAGVEWHTGRGAVALPLTEIAGNYVILHLSRNTQSLSTFQRSFLPNLYYSLLKRYC